MLGTCERREFRAPAEWPGDCQGRFCSQEPETRDPRTSPQDAGRHLPLHWLRTYLDWDCVQCPGLSWRSVVTCLCIFAAPRNGKG